MSREVNHGRRRFLGTAVLTMAAAELVIRAWQISELILVDVPMQP